MILSRSLTKDDLISIPLFRAGYAHKMLTTNEILEEEINDPNNNLVQFVR